MPDKFLATVATVLSLAGHEGQRDLSALWCQACWKWSRLFAQGLIVGDRGYLPRRFEREPGFAETVANADPSHISSGRAMATAVASIIAEHGDGTPMVVDDNAPPAKAGWFAMAAAVPILKDLGVESPRYLEPAMSPAALEAQAPTGHMKMKAAEATGLLRAAAGL